MTVGTFRDGSGLGVGDSAGSDALHTYFGDRLVPVCDSVLEAALGSDGTPPPVDACTVLKGIRNLCVGAADDRPV